MEETKWREELESTSQLISGAEEKLNAATVRADEILKDAEGRREQVEQLYGLITDTATSGAFGDEAEEQKQQADNWRRNAIRLGSRARSSRSCSPQSTRTAPPPRTSARSSSRSC